MTEDEFHSILDRYRKGECSEEEEKMVEEFYQKNQDKPSVVATWTAEEKEAARSAIRQQVWKHVREPISKTRHEKRYSWLKMAAAVLLLVAAGLGAYVSLQQDPPTTTYLTKATQRGQQATITLGDGSIVKLNAESSITFPEVFSGEIRDISLVGEAFFEVKRNPSKPFVIQSGDLQTTVLGTSFNVEAYPGEEEIKVTVATGKVKVSHGPGRAEASILTPGQQVRYHTITKAVEKREVSLASFLDWREGIIRFDDIPLKKALKILERWFDTEIWLENPALGECYIKSTYRQESLENILESMKFINALEYEFQDEKTVLIKGKECN